MIHFGWNDPYPLHALFMDSYFEGVPHSLYMHVLCLRFEFLNTAILDFPLPIWLHSIRTTSIELLDPKKYGCSCWNFVPILSASWDISTSGFEAAILDFRLPVWSHSIEPTSIGLLDPKNMRVADGISFLSHLQAEIRGGGGNPRW